MTVHDLHDALNLLPSDLITAADRVRTGPKTKVVYWKRMIPAAACFVLLVGLGLVLRGEDMLGHMMKTESAPEAPAAMAPVPESQKVTADAAAPELPADIAVPESPAEEEPAAKAPTEAPMEGGGSSNSASMGTDEKAAEEELHIDHSHRFAEQAETVEDPVEGYCGNMEVSVDIAGHRYVVSGSDAVKVTDILVNLAYDPAQVCRCMAEFTVDTETLTGIQVNLTEAFARCELGQAALTEEQAATLQKIIESLQ